MTDSGTDKVYVYDADGNYQSDRDFDLATGNTYPVGWIILWTAADKVYVYYGNYQSGATSTSILSTFPPWQNGAYLYVVDSNAVYDAGRTWDRLLR